MKKNYHALPLSTHKAGSRTVMAIFVESRRGFPTFRMSPDHALNECFMALWKNEILEVL